MTEETNSTVDQGNNQDLSNNQSNEQGAQPAQISHSLKSTLDFLYEGKAGDEFLKDLEGLKKDVAGQNNNQDQPDKVLSDKAAADKVAAEKLEADRLAAAGEGVKKPDPKIKEIDTPLFGKQELGKKTPAETPVELKEFSDIQAYVKTNYGVEDVQKFLTESVPKFREQAQKLGDSEKKVTEFTNIFEKLPEPLFNAVKSHLEGNDWKEEITKAPKLDFNKKVDDIDKKTLIDTYFPGKFSKEDFDSEEENSVKTLDIALEAAKRSFMADKTSFDNKIQVRINNETRQQELFTKSIGTSVERLQKDLPHVNEMALKDVSSIMEEGPGAVMAELFNTDGSWKEEAATKIAMLKHGFKTMETYMQIARNQAETEVNETFVAKAPDKLVNQTPGGNNKTSEALTKGLSVLTGLNRGKTF